MPSQVPWWGLDQMSDGGDFDYLSSSVYDPNPSYMFAITDLQRNGTVQMQFQMPTANLSATAGLYGRARFYSWLCGVPLHREAQPALHDHRNPAPNAGNRVQRIAHCARPIKAQASPGGTCLV